MLGLLIWLLILIVIFAIVFWIVQTIGLPAPWNKIALAIIGLIFLIIMLSVLFGAVPYPPAFHYRP